MWRVRLCHEVLIIKIAARSAPEGFLTSCGRPCNYIIPSCVAKHRHPTSWNVTEEENEVIFGEAGESAMMQQLMYLC